MERDALLLTLRLAVTTTAILLVIAAPLAWWIAAGGGAVRAAVQAIVALPLVLPPTVLGFYLLVGLGPTTAIGRWLTARLGHTLAFSFSGLLLGSMLYSLPFAVQPMVAGLRSLDRELLEGLSAAGAPPARVLWDVVLPMSRASLLTSGLLTLTHTIGEFGVVLMLGGNIPGVTRTVSISIYDLVEDGRYAAAHRASMALLLVSAAALMLVYLLPGQRRERARGGLLG